MSWELVTGSLGTLVLGLIGLWSKAKIDKRANQLGMSEQHRLDFEAILAPLQAEVGDLRTRVTTLEMDVRAERDLRERILGYARSLYWAWKRQFPEHTPPDVPPSIEGYFN